ncbi:MAG TPA: VWA domain-containing protein [Gemmatimonadaceae bacterium]
MQPQVLVDYELSVARQGYIVRALVKIAGKEPEGSAHTPLNLALVLDRSGSMAGEKLERAKEAAAFLVRRLRAHDRVGVVAYDDEVTTVARSAEAGAHTALGHAIAAIRSGGCTNLSGGWFRGQELVAGAKPMCAEGTLHRVMLLTDGQANLGITDPVQLVGICRAAARVGISTTTIGFGEDYDEALLRAMADAGRGNAWYIERPDQAPGVFEEEIEGLLSLSAQNLSVTIREGDAVQFIGVQNDYLQARTPEGIRVELGDLYAREPRSLLIEFFVPGLDERAQLPIAELVISAVVLTATGGIERQQVTMTIVSGVEPAGVKVPEIQREVLLMEAARAREEAVERQRRGDTLGASDVLSAAATRLAMEGPAEFVGVLREQAEDLAALAAQVREDPFSAADEKYLAQRAYNARRGKAGYEEKLARGAPRKRD